MPHEKGGVGFSMVVDGGVGGRKVLVDEEYWCRDEIHYPDP